MRRVYLLAIALPALGASCGGSDTEAHQPQARLTQQQFVSRANAVCMRSDRRVYKLGRLSLDPAGWAATAKAAQRGVAEMQVLRPPVSADAGFRRMLTHAQRLADDIQRVHDALVKKHYAAARSAQRDATNADT